MLIPTLASATMLFSNVGLALFSTRIPTLPP